MLSGRLCWRAVSATSETLSAMVVGDPVRLREGNGLGKRGRRVRGDCT